MLKKNLFPLLLAVGLLVGGANLAVYASNGQPLRLGKANTESKSAKVKNTGNGPALKLVTKPGAPPLKVSSATKVDRLNADLLDGLDGAALQTQTVTYKLSGFQNASTIKVGFPGLPAGLYLASVNVAADMTLGADTIRCFMGTLTNPIVPGFAANGVTRSSQSTVSMTGVVDTRTVGTALTCTSSGAPILTTQPLDAASTVTFTRIDATASLDAVILP